MKFTQIPADTFENIQLNAGILLDSFTPSTGVIGNLIGATSGGVNFNAAPSYTDYGEDIDNCPKNTKELKKLDSWEIKMSGSFVTVTAALAKRLIGAADVSGSKITPRNDVNANDFEDIWWVGDYSDKNGANNGGYCAIHMLNSLSTAGFQIQSGDKSKGSFSFEFTAHYSMAAQTTVPFEIYVQSGSAESGDYNMTIESEAGSSTGKTAITTSETAGSGESYVYQTGYSLAVPAQNTILAGTAWTTWDGDDEITATEGMDIVVAIVDAENKAQHAGKTIVVAA